MNEEMKLLLKLMLAQQEEAEAEQKKKKKEPDPDVGIDYDPAEKPKKGADVQKEYLEHDLTPEMKASYQEHQSVQPKKKEVPIWEKYALSTSEAAEYFHLSYRKIREIIARDKYADFLIWNGTKVYIKRKLFEEFLDKSNSL